MNEYVLAQCRMHPSMQPQDIVKLCYQAVFGADHLLKDIEYARQMFLDEYRRTPAEDVPLTEDISDLYCRGNIAGWKYQGLDGEELFKRFVEAAGSSTGSTEQFLKSLKKAIDTLKNIWSPEKMDELNEYLKEYLKNGIRAVSHSPVYHQNEKPAYRVILRKQETGGS
ncbi:MAG: hypothetical protein II126_03485 [Erysipelotrichaceae bacterium]|nr:hypothetical protein [Erysipelotrichaceae bacterium]